MIGIVDYGAGNLANLIRSLDRLGLRSRVISHPDDLGYVKIGESTGNPQILILPGVGSFGSAVKTLRESRWDRLVLDWVHHGRPLIGICLGMQLLFQRSLEDGEHQGLGIFQGTVEPYRGNRSIHMGWDRVRWLHSPPALSDGAFYFVHRYCCYQLDDAWGTADPIPFVAAARRGSVMGFQFHPERSGANGLELLGMAIREVA